jgi:hypothetical protein
MGVNIVPRHTTDPNEVGIYKVTVTYTQEPDTNSNSDEWQYLECSTDTVCGDEFYINIKTDRWSINDPEELLTVLNDFKSRIS